jgi:hypothetical protein
MKFHYIALVMFKDRIVQVSSFYEAETQEQAIVDLNEHGLNITEIREATRDELMLDRLHQFRDKLQPKSTKLKKPLWRRLFRL